MPGSRAKSPVARTVGSVEDDTTKQKLNASVHDDTESTPAQQDSIDGAAPVPPAKSLPRKRRDGKSGR